MSPGLLAFAAGRSGGRGGRSRVDANAVIDAAGLPDELAALVLAVTKKCRLWGSERADIARELCGHFRDGLEAGVSSDELAAAFGDPAMAARLMTVSRKRLRPLWWRGMRGAVRGAGVCLVVCIAVYAVLAARFYLRTPNIARNITGELNAAALAAPRGERAWPLYVEARRQFGVLPEFMEEPEFVVPLRVDDPYWAPMTAWLDAHENALATVRRAAGQPVLGYRYTDAVDPELIRAMEETVPGYSQGTPETVSENPMLFGVLLPHLSELRRFARYLQTDLALAASRGDGERYLADVHALLGMGDHVFRERFLISNLVGMAIADLTFRTVAETVQTPGLLSDEELRELAHLLGGFASGRITVDASGELLMVDDLLQRFFSDDGRGGGQFVGGSELERMYDEWGIARPRVEALLKAYRPIQSVLIESRAEIRERAEDFVAVAAADDALPPWRHGERRSDEAYRELEATGIYSLMPIFDYLLGDESEGPILKATAQRDLVETWRATALTVIAAEAYRRAHGAWPRSLSQLAPAYLPRVPLDPFTGEPLGYIAPREKGALPLLYSVGVDQVDDGGVPPEGEPRSVDVHSFELFRKRLGDLRKEQAGEPTDPAARVPKGDWVLWPRG